MARLHRAKTWLDRLSFGKSRPAAASGDHSSSSKQFLDGSKSVMCGVSDRIVATSGATPASSSERTRGACNALDVSQSKAPKQVRSGGRSEKEIRSSMPTENSSTLQAVPPAQPCINKTGRSRFARDDDLRETLQPRRGAASSPGSVEHRRRLSLTRGNSLSVPCSATFQFECSPPRSPLRHVYSTAAAPSTSSMLLRSSSHTSSCSGNSSASGISTIGRAAATVVPQRHAPKTDLLRVRSRPETYHTSARAPQKIGTEQACWTAASAARGPCGSLSGSAAHRLVQAERLVLTVKDCNKEKLRLLFHSRSTTVGQVKEQIQMQMGNNTSQQHLTYNGDPLTNDLPLGSFICGCTAVVHMHVPFRDLPLW